MSSASNTGTTCCHSGPPRVAAIWLPEQQQESRQNLVEEVTNILTQKQFECQTLQSDSENVETESRKKLQDANRLVLVLDNSMTHREREFCAKIMQTATLQPVCVIEDAENAFNNLAESWPALKEINHIKKISRSNLANEFDLWIKKKIVFLLSVGAWGEQILSEFDSIIEELHLLGYETCQNRSNLLEWDGISNNMEKCNRVVAVYFKPPGKIPSHARGHLYHLAIDQCICQKKSLMCIIKAFSATDSENEDKVFENHRIRHFTEMVEDSSRERRLNRLKDWLDSKPALPEVNVNFGSLGASFAWQFATGFLSFILPNLLQKITEKLTDTEANCIRQQILDDCVDVKVNAKSVCILEKFVILLKENDLDVENHVNPYPDELLRGCKKVKLQSRDGKPLELEFESPGYPKRIPAYIMEFDNQLSTENATYTHVIVFGCFATPTSVLHDLHDLSSDEKHQEYRVFREELQFILNHPKADDLLLKFGVMEREDVTENAEKSACVIQLDRDKTENHWNPLIRSRIREEIENQDAADRMTEAKDETQDEKSLLLKFSRSITEDQQVELNKRLVQMQFGTRNFEMMTRSFAQVLLKCKRILLIATLKDLEECRNAYDLPEYDDARHNHLMRDINSAVTYMHKREEYNLVLIVVTGGKKMDIYSVLPSSLKILPENNVVSVVNLNPDNLDAIHYAFTEGVSQQVTFEDLIGKLRLTEKGTKVDENLPLMSMAYAMAANTCLGFLAILIEHLKQETPQPFNLPYFYILPASGRYPDAENLVEPFKEIGVTQGKKEFRNSEGRLYTYKVYSRDNYQVAFEIPPCILNLRKQATCGLGGVRRRDLKHNLKEYCLAMQDIIKQKEWQDCFRMVQWDDVTDLPSDGWKNPTKEYVESLWRLLTKAVFERQESFASQLSSQS